MEKYGIIYKITNVKNGKNYIGQTTNKKGFNGRYPHKGEGVARVHNYLKKVKGYGGHYNSHLLNSIEKYGEQNFTVDEEFAIAYSKEELDKLEDYYIRKFDCINNGYNERGGGACGKFSQDVKDKVGEASKRYWSNEDNRRKKSEAQKERWKNIEYKEKMLGYAIGENNPMFGKHHNEEAKRKIRESKIGKHTGANNHRSKKVKIFTKENVLIKEFVSITDISKWILENFYIETKAINPVDSVRGKVKKALYKKQGKIKLRTHNGAYEEYILSF